MFQFNDSKKMLCGATIKENLTPYFPFTFEYTHVTIQLYL